MAERSLEPCPRVPLVGRTAELEQLTGLLGEAAAGQPVVVLVSGEAGVGKTRLVSELTAVAAGRGFTVLTGHCAELADSVPYLPLADALRDAETGPAAAAVAAAVASRPVLSRLLPDRQPAAPDGPGQPGLAQQQLFGAVLGMLGELAAAAPVLLALEDLHWADRSTRDLVTFLSRVLHREPIALVVTYRTDDLHRRHPLRPVLAELQRLPSVTAADLRPLSPEAMAEHLTALSGGQLSWPVLDTLVGRAEGNAYYAEELLTATQAFSGSALSGSALSGSALSGSALSGSGFGGALSGGALSGSGDSGIDGGAPSGGLASGGAAGGAAAGGGAAFEGGAGGGGAGGGAAFGGGGGGGGAAFGGGAGGGGAGGGADGTRLPAGLADLLLARAERLSPAAQQVLRVAAAAGRHVDDALVQRASALAPREYDEAVREAAAAHLLVPDGERGLAFRHALLREAIYGDLLPGERTRLHGLLAELLSDEQQLAAVAGSAAQLAHHALASHDIPAGFAASVRAGEEAERLAAPAEAHQHFDQALSLWDRVADPEKLGGIARGDLALRSALASAASGDISRAVHQLKRLRDYLTSGDDPALVSRVSERLAMFLLELDDDAGGLEVARAAVNVLPADPPRPERAVALSTLALGLMANGDYPAARSVAEQARTAGRAGGAPWAVADALVTLGTLAEKSGRPKTAAASYARARSQARRAGDLTVELRATFQVARIQLERGDLTAASETAHEGMQVAARAGLAMAPWGYDLQYLHYLAHFSDGDWDHAQEIADGFAIRASGEAEARLSAMALFIEVGRGSDTVDQRCAWLAPFIARDLFTEYTARGLLAERAWWQGDSAAALEQAAATIQAVHAWGGPAAPQLIRPAAIWLAALADQAGAARASGDAAALAATAAEADRVIAFARAGSANKGRPLGVDGLGWLARAEAEWRRASGDNDPAAWQAVLDAFGPGFAYEAARCQWRLAEALAQAGDREAARPRWESAIATADRLGAAPLRRALADLGRRARLGAGPDGSRPRGTAPHPPASRPPASRPPGSRSPGSGAPWPGGTGPGPGSGSAGLDRGPLAGLTSREAEVLGLLAVGRSNREIAAALFIAPKTASVHVSNILAKLGASTRTEAAAIAHSNGVQP